MVPAEVRVTQRDIGFAIRDRMGVRLLVVRVSGDVELIMWF
jgi:hypothetical protein